jgi:hypothetical protein
LTLIFYEHLFSNNPEVRKLRGMRKGEGRGRRERERGEGREK